MNSPSQPKAEIEARQRWLAVLAKAPLDELEAACEALGDKPAYRALRPGETGLVMVRGRAGGGVTWTGFGHVAGRSPRRAELVALFDALMQDPTRHGLVERAVVAPLAAQQEAAKATQAAKVTASKVDFF